MKIANLCISTALTGCAFLLSGCGAFGALEPKDGNTLPVKAYGQIEEQTAERLLVTSPQARPNREQEILSRSTIRSEDPFDLPPEGDLGPIPKNLDPIIESNPDEPSG